MEKHETHSSRILLFGSPRLGRSIAAILRSRGHEVHRTPNVDGAADLIRRLGPDLVIVSFEPGWLRQAEAIKEIADFHPDPPILMAGGLRANSQLAPLPSIELPVPPSDLHRTVAQLLANHVA